MLFSLLRESLKFVIELYEITFIGKLCTLIFSPSLHIYMSALPGAIVQQRTMFFSDLGKLLLYINYKHLVDQRNNHTFLKYFHNLNLYTILFMT